MIIMDNELIVAMHKFQEVFGDIVPLRELPQTVSNKEVIDAINDSIKKQINVLPERFSFTRIEKDKNILV